MEIQTIMVNKKVCNSNYLSIVSSIDKRFEERKSSILDMNYE